MDVPTEQDITDYNRLDALYEAGDGGAREVTASVLDEHFEQTDERYPWLRQMADDGLVSMSQGLTPLVKVSPAGARQIEESRSRRDDRGARRTACRQRLLAWTDQQPTDRLANAETFLPSNYGWFEGVRFEWEEVTAAAGHLAEADLIRNSPTREWGGQVVILDVAISDKGRECIDDYGGDPAAYRAAQQRTAPTVHVEGSGNALSLALGAQSSATTTSTTVDAEAARLLAAALAEALPGLHLDDPEAAKHLEDLQGDDEGRKRKALRWFGGLATNTSASAIGQVLGGVALSLGGFAG